jgi:hypothetical protein
MLVVPGPGHHKQRTRWKAQWVIKWRENGRAIGGKRTAQNTMAQPLGDEKHAAVIFGFLAATTEVDLRGRWVKHMYHELCCFLHPDAEGKTAQ